MDKEPKGADLKVGDKLPQFSVEMSDGTIISTTNLKDKTAIITFFNTDCEDCRRELPYLQEAYDKYSFDTQIVFVLIAREENRAKIDEYWEKTGLTMPYSAQKDRTIYNLFATTGIPRTYVADENGIITAVFTTSLAKTQKY